jgi:thiamine-phosphate pyrophosphorylase
LLAKVAEAVRARVDYVQLREKDLSTRELERLGIDCAEIIQRLRTENREFKTRLLINSRSDIALAAGADGVHLRSDDVSASTARSVWSKVMARSRSATRGSVIAVSCRTSSDVLRAESEGADLVVFAPVFGKMGARDSEPRGLPALREACAGKIPVLALGGVTLGNADSCLAAGAAGVAGIRLFQENRIEDVVQTL